MTITQYSVEQLRDALECVLAGPNGGGKARYALRFPVAYNMLVGAITELELLRKQSEKLCRPCKAKYPASSDMDCPRCGEQLIPYITALTDAQAEKNEKLQERNAFLEELIQDRFGLKDLTE